MEIKNKIEAEIKIYLRHLDKRYSLKKISPLLFNSIVDFVLRKGKRVRPILFIVGYLGFAKKAATGLYRSALALELLHDFMLVHDDIIDNSEMRRGKPSMHAALNGYLKQQKNIKFNGQDLSIVIGDIMYALGLDAFLSVEENKERKELAFRKLIEAALYTGTGEFIELIYGIKSINKITKEEIYKIYDLKTANYTFASPLSMGAILSGAKKDQVDKLNKYGLCLGRAFQIKDDILGMFGATEEIGKSNLTDLQEAKKTLLVWYAYNHSNKREKSIIGKILSADYIDNSDLQQIRRIVCTSGSLEYAKSEIASLLEKSIRLNKSLLMRQEYKLSLDLYSKELLK